MRGPMVAIGWWQPSWSIDARSPVVEENSSPGPIPPILPPPLPRIVPQWYSCPDDVAQQSICCGGCHANGPNANKDAHCHLVGMVLLSPGTKPYAFLCMSQPTTNPQHPSTCRDLNGWQQLPWCLTPDADADNSCPECWQIVLCGGARSGAPWRPWEDGGRHDQRGTV